MSEEMIEHIIGCFAKSAAFAKELGYGMVMIPRRAWVASQPVHVSAAEYAA
jgi:hypothetical protein